MTHNQPKATPLIPLCIAEVEQLEKMVQDILVVCVLPSADQDTLPSACLGPTGLAAPHIPSPNLKEIQLELPCAAMERLQRFGMIGFRVG